MVTIFLGERTHARLRRAAKSSRWPGMAAVAFFAKDAAKLLPLKKGSKLVVNASESAVKNGSTSPTDLLILHDKGVNIFNDEKLHAKVFVFGRTAFVGSSNISQTSAGGLKEAIVETTDAKVVRAARAFVRELCRHSMGPAKLEELKSLYRPPKFLDGQPVGRRRRRSSSRNATHSKSLRLVQLILGNDPEGSETAFESGRKVANAKRKHRKTHLLESFRWNNDTFKKGQHVVQIVDEQNGPKLVTAPGEVINTKRWSNGRQQCTFVYLEVPSRRRIRVNKLAKRLGKGAAKKLRRSGAVTGDFANRLVRVWTG